MRTKNFKVLTVSDNPNSFGLHGHILVAKDGEAYEVGRSRGDWLTPWNKGDIVPITFHRRNPNWAGLSVEIPRKLPKAPAKVVKEVWDGKSPVDNPGQA